MNAPRQEVIKKVGFLDPTPTPLPSLNYTFPRPLNPRKYRRFGCGVGSENLAFFITSCRVRMDQKWALKTRPETAEPGSTHSLLTTITSATEVSQLAIGRSQNLEAAAAGTPPKPGTQFWHLGSVSCPPGESEEGAKHLALGSSEVRVEH
jgi:hypothetical protein